MPILSEPFRQRCGAFWAMQDRIAVRALGYYFSAPFTIEFLVQLTEQFRTIKLTLLTNSTVTAQVQ